ncbi:ABC transporter [Candidatus Saccharibacteria bacterium]|nr:MAG: ABC transporter [Candidatus Saccharibacteria bacterium]
MVKAEPTLKLEKLTKKYGSTLAVDDLSLEIQPGEIFGFLGPNGAGKSTTIRTILDFIRPTSGQISIFSQTDPGEKTAYRCYVGHLAGDIALYGNMTGRKLFKHLSQLGYKTDWDYVKELTAGFEANLDVPIRSLSKGNRQKIGLIQALMHRPKLIILDEPTSGLDPLMKERLYEFLRQAAQQGASVFFSSHDIAEVQKICDRTGFIRQGKLIAVEDMHSAKQLVAHYYTATFAKKPKLAGFKKIKSVENIDINDHEVTFTVRGQVTEFLSELA